MKPDISIIVPIYNVESYLEKCLFSLINQSHKNIEIICINDGSTDKSEEIIEKYIKLDSRIKSFNQENKGVATARNKGLELAQSPYIQFCDPDDSYDVSMCETMLGLINNDVDFAICGMNITYESHKKLKKSDLSYYSIKYEGITKLNDDIRKSTDCSLVTKIFKKSLIDKYNLRFPDGLIYEDAYFVTLYFLLSKNAFFSKKKLYNYVRREKSIMSSTFQKNEKAIDHFYIAVNIYEFLLNNNLLNSHIDYFRTLFLTFFYFSLRHLPTEKIHRLLGSASSFLQRNSNIINSTNIDEKTILTNIFNKKYTHTIKKKFLGIPIIKIKISFTQQRIMFFKLRIFKKELN